MIPPGARNEERPALNLSGKEWLVVGLLVGLLVLAAPAIPIRPPSPIIERDYRIPYALSRHYELYRRYTTLGVAQFPTLLVGDSVVWGQCARRDQTLSHHLNEMTREPRFANAGLDGMHPLALVELLTYHAPAIQGKRVFLQFNPFWLILTDPSLPPRKGTLFNRPDLIPRLAAPFKSALQHAIEVSGSRLFRDFPLRDWGDRLADSRLDFLAWSLDHPYESPLRAISSTLPPSEDLHSQRLTSWDRSSGTLLNAAWADPDIDVTWTAFEQILQMLQGRGNRILVLLGPLNEHLMAPPMRERYQALKLKMAARLKTLGVRCFVASLLPETHYADLCHPLGAGYEAIAQELLREESAWLLDLDEPR